MSISSRTIIRLVLFALIVTLSLGVSWAGLTEGSTAVSRSFVDTAAGQVFIYDGGAFNNPEQVTTFSFFQSAFTGNRFMTPILFEETAAGQFVVRGIGASQTIVGTGVGTTNSFVFQPVQAGSDTTNSGLFFFGYINATVNAAGTQLLTSAGTVTFNSTVDAGTGVDGVSSNDWVFTSSSLAGITVGLGTVFFQPGHDPGTGTRFALNSGSGAFQTDRTYSANLTGIAASGVPEPGTLTLFTSGAGLLLAGLLRFRRKS
jgi:hypothetical protein